VAGTVNESVYFLLYKSGTEVLVTHPKPRIVRKAQRMGFTLIEVCAVLALIAVLAALGYQNLNKMMPRYRMMQTAKELRADLMGLRMSAIQNNRQTRLLLVDSDGDWESPGSANVGHWKLQIGNKSLRSNSWDTFPQDADQDGTDDATQKGNVEISAGGQDQVRSVSLAPWEVLLGPGLNNADAIVFGPRGHVINPATDFGVDGTITLTLVNKQALLDGGEDTVALKIARTGLVRLQTSIGSEETLSFGTDNVTTTGGP
jgi:prepilin-type N-terminal cleavage/methylation domain-containing protein